MTLEYTIATGDVDGAGGYLLDGNDYSDLLVVETFEDGDAANWNFFDYPTDRYAVNSTAALGGSNYGLRMGVTTSGSGFIRGRSMPSYSEPLRNYPRPGYVLTFRFEYTSINTSAQWRLNFNKEADTDSDEYELQFLGNEGTFRLTRDDNSTTGKEDVAGDYGNFPATTGVEYEVRLHWDSRYKSTEFYGEIIDTRDSTVVSSFSGDDTLGDIFNGYGVEIWVNEYNSIYIDELYLEP